MYLVYFIEFVWFISFQKWNFLLYFASFYGKGGEQGRGQKLCLKMLDLDLKDQGLDHFLLLLAVLRKARVLILQSFSYPYM